MEDEIETGQQPEPKTAKTGRETFSHEYVNELREEAKSYRINASEFKRQLEEQAAKHATDIDAAVNAAKLEAAEGQKKEVAMARLEAAAVKAGIVDSDALKLVDKSQFVFDDAGNITNATEVLEAFKTAKPHFFGSLNTSQTSPMPKPDNTAKDATKMSDEEWKAEMKKMGVR